MRRHPTLRDAAVFRGLDTPVIADLTDQLPRAYFRAGQLIFATGEPGDRLYLVLEGKVKIGRRACDGREGLLLIVGPTEMFGAISVLDPAPRESTATAVTNVVAVTVDRDTLTRWLHRHPQMAEQFMRLVSRQLRRNDTRLADMVTADVSDRVAKLLLGLAQQFGVHEDGAIRLKHDLAQEEIGQLVGASREHVNKVLSEFSRRGWIRIHGKSMLILGLPGTVRGPGPFLSVTSAGEAFS